MKRTELTRIVSALMATLCAIGFCACANANEKGNETQTEEATVAQEQETVDERYECDLEPLDYHDEEIHFLYADKIGRQDELPAEDLGLGVVSDAVYERNSVVEKTLKVKLDFIPSLESSILSDHSNDVKGGTGAFDIVVDGLYMAIAPSTQGQYIDLTPLQNIDTSKLYWSQGFNEISTFTSEGCQFLATGDAALSAYRLMYLTIYNKTLFEANHLDDLYEVVKNNEWTLDYQYNILKDRYVDSDGNNKKSKGDSFGFVTGNCVSTDPYLTACNARMVMLDKELGELVYWTESEALLYDLVEKVQLIYHSDSTYVFNSSTEDDVGLNFIVETFAEGRSLMATLIFWNMEHSFSELAKMSYGIAPMPKLSVEQKNYYSYVQDQVSTFGISSAVKSEDRREMAAAVLELMMYQSHKTVIPAYYEISLSYKYMQDPQSTEILGIVCDSQAYDFALQCCGLTGNTRTLLAGKKNTAASALKGWSRLLNNKLKEYNRAIEKIS